MLIVNFDENENSKVMLNSTSSNRRTTFRKSKKNKASIVAPIVIIPVAVIAITIITAIMLKKKPEKLNSERTSESTYNNINIKI